MNKKLDEKLCKDYPEIFKERHGDVQSTAMCWGFSCGDGWYPLIDELCSALTSEVTHLRNKITFVEETLAKTDKSAWDRCLIGNYTEEKLAEEKQKLKAASDRIPVAVQVKEKFGGLRFYVCNATEEQRQYIRFAERLSYRICEECGATKDTVFYPIGWNRTLCPEHADIKYGNAAEEHRKKLNTAS